MREASAGVLLLAGVFFLSVGTLGLFRMPDAYTRMHTAAKCDTLGAGLVLLSLAVDHGWSVFSLKLFLLLTFHWITSPTATHIMARAALRAGIAPALGTRILDLRSRTRRTGR